MSANPISDKELSSLLKRAAAALESLDSEYSHELIEDLDRAAALLDRRRGIEQD